MTDTGIADLVKRLRALKIMDEVGSDNPLGRQAADALEAAVRVIAPMADEEPQWIEMGDSRPLYPGCRIKVVDTRNAVDWIARHATGERKGGDDDRG